ncbi:MAG: DnaJ domain-containing protein [Nannocystaceae bacterium]
MATVAWDRMTWDVEDLDLPGLVDFISSNEVALVFSDSFGFTPSGLVIFKLSQQRPDVRVGRIRATSLVRAPAGVRDKLGPQLRAHGISDLWLPSGYYLFFRGHLVGYRDPGVPKTLKGYWPTLLVGGLAVIERLATQRWGRFIQMLPTALDATLNGDLAGDFASLLGDAVRSSRRTTSHGESSTGSGSTSGERSTSRGEADQGSTRSGRDGGTGPTHSGRGGDKGPRSGRAASGSTGARGSTGSRASQQRGRGKDQIPPEPWPKDPYETLGVTQAATNDQIKSSYRRATSRFHPDKARDEKERASRTAWQKQLNLAYATLREARGF